MPAIACNCGRRISYGEIPCAHEWLVISDTDFDRLSGHVDVDQIYNTATSLLRCPECGRLWIFWKGFDHEPSEYIPTAPPQKLNPGS